MRAMAMTFPREGDCSGELSEKRRLRVAFHTLGCRSNYADTVDIQSAVSAREAVACDFDGMADVYVLNTCTVTDDADRSAYKLIRRVRDKHPEARVIVTGCLAEVSATELCKPGLADVVIGTGRASEVVAAIFAEVKAVKEPRSLPVALEGPGSAVGENRMRARYSLRIQDGCDNHCTFCVIPQTRGKSWSWPIEKVMGDIKRLWRAGYREVVLSGTNLGSYGRERNESFIELLAALSKEKEIPRIRLSSLDPEDVGDEFLGLIADKCDVFCNHLHICVQSFSDRVLKLMNRRHRVADVVKMISYIAAKMPKCCVGIDCIVGFPGESEQCFSEGLAILESLPLAYLHVFPYSERQNTAAAKLQGRVDNDERRRRAALLRALSRRRLREFNRSLVGREVEIIVESSRAGYICGTTREYATAHLKTQSGIRNIELSVGAVAKLRAIDCDENEDVLICEL